MSSTERIASELDEAHIALVVIDAQLQEAIGTLKANACEETYRILSELQLKIIENHSANVQLLADHLRRLPL